MRQEYNRLLRRQIRKYLPDAAEREELKAFLDAVDDSYQQYEGIQYLRDRAVELGAKELQQKNQQLREKNELLNSFVYRASHDLKNPLFSLASLLEMLSELLPEDETLNPQVHSIMSHMKQSTNNMLVKIQDLLELSRMDHLLRAQPEIMDLKTEFESLLQEQAPNVQAHQAHIHYDFSKVPKMMMARENLRSILSNLLSNAIKYRSPERTPEIRLHTWVRKPEFCLQIQDNGLGMDLEQQGNKLFGMFERFHPQVEGSGVGLFILKKIMDTVKGRIEVKSEVGSGTTFYLFFPFSLLPKPAAQPVS